MLAVRVRSSGTRNKRPSTGEDRATTRARGDGGPTTSGSFHATGCGAQGGECCVGAECEIRCSAVTREARPSHRRKRAYARSRRGACAFLPAQLRRERNAQVLLCGAIGTQASSGQNGANIDENCQVLCETPLHVGDAKP